ncbi:MAG: hypothetical protein K2W82_13705 [Candidatus Obscuribacterales bacterium]|nr:hypothetical protein [Candidatus Obscuribacterales bacterium]
MELESEEFDPPIRLTDREERIKEMENWIELLKRRRNEDDPVKQLFPEIFERQKNGA